MDNEGICHISCFCGGQRDGLWPPCGSVNDCQQVCTTIGRRWQGSYQIHMDVGEPHAWDWDFLWLDMNMLVNFCFLALDALLCPQTNVFVHALPQEPVRNEAAYGPHSGMSQSVEMVKDFLPFAGGDERTKKTSGHIAEKAMCTYRNVGDDEAGVLPVSYTHLTLPTTPYV